jgi:hypothetical protein
MYHPTKQSALTEIEQLKKQIEELEARINATDSEELPGPLTTPLKIGERYFAVNLMYNSPLELTWDGVEFDLGFLQASLLFPHTDLGQKAAEERAKRGLIKLYEAAEPLKEKPEYRTPYYCYAEGDVSYSKWLDDSIDNERFNSGNVFPLTTEGAIGASEYGKSKPK